MNKDKMKTMAFSNLVGSIIFLAIGIWAWFQTDNFPEVANTYVQASTFPRVMIVGMLIFSVVLLIQSIFKLMGTMKPTDPVAVEVKDKGVAAAYLVMLLCVLFAALFKSCGYILCAVVLSMIIMFLIGKRNWVQMVLVSVLVPLLMWLVFYKVLTVNIPLGPLNFLRTLVDMI